MTFLFISFAAGLLTVLAPCILPLLPVVIGSSATGRSRFTPFIVVGSLALSIIAFTFLLKVSTAFITIPPEVWTYISGGILALFGLTLVFPALWDHIPGLAKLSASSNKMVGTGYQKKSFWGDVVIGAALGPVFSTCSPTYFVILASVLPASFLLGTTYLLAYVVGLSLSLLVLAVVGERLANRLSGLADPKGWFKRTIGVLFIILGLMIVTGYEKKLEAALLTGGVFDVTKIEQKLLQDHAASTGGNALLPTGDTTPNVSKRDMTTSAGTTTPSKKSSSLSLAMKAARYPVSPELVSPDGYLNTKDLPISIGQFKGKKVVLVDFWTYSCINCQRTTPYLNSWYDKYEKDGLVIIGVHTPEFGFEKVKDNVAQAIQKEGIRYPVVLDNQYQTWNAFKNQYWPRKYLVDIDGFIVYDHVGEGEYTETEIAIQKALQERADRMGTAPVDTKTVSITPVEIEAQSPETYFGSGRNQFLTNGKAFTEGSQTLTASASGLSSNMLYLDGTWNFEREYTTNTSTSAKILYTYTAKRVYFVASADKEVTVTVLRDGVPLPAELRGKDVGSDGKVRIKESRLYDLVQEKEKGSHTLELKIEGAGLRAFTFTFG